MKRLIVIAIALAVSSPALAGHRGKASKRSHKTTVAQASNPQVRIAGDPTDPLGGLGTIPHKKSKKNR